MTYFSNGSTTLPDLDQLDIVALKALIVERQEIHVEALSSQAQQIEHLKLIVEKPRRMMFGSKSEKVTIQVE
jgi:transposase